MFERTRWLALGSVLVAVTLLAAVGCGDDDEDSSTGGSDGKKSSSVAATLREYEIQLDKDAVPAGSVTFKAKNTGPDDPHELVVVKTNLAPNQLPTSADGAADEEGAGVEVIGEIEEFAVGGEEEMTLDLSPGKYVLLCNVVDEEEGDAGSHYKNGMRTAFTVE